ncbi:uncharacterized protein, partial [Mycetomoellerius zeteki]|uniref:uncharacterized protein n=1 Tax=Mycetomoellerius zeteki TaxID=64791 RepID=UPI00084E8114
MTVCQVQRRLSQRIVRAYRTVSHDATTVLADVPSADILARGRAEVYRWVAVARLEGRVLAHREIEAYKTMAQKWVFAEWRARLEKAEHGAWTVGAVRPCLEEWAGRRWGGLTYQLTQVLTGHGCFGEYLHRILKERSPHCHHCDADVNTARHTLVEWDVER